MRSTVCVWVGVLVEAGVERGDEVWVLETLGNEQRDLVVQLHGVFGRWLLLPNHLMQHVLQLLQIARPHLEPALTFESRAFGSYPIRSRPIL